MLGYTSEEIIKLSYKDITPEKWHMIEDLIVDRQVCNRGYSDIYEKEYRKKDGTVFPIELRTTLLRDKDGTPKSMWATVRDITERKQVEKDREKLILELLEAMKNVKTLRGLLPICASCKNIRDDKGYWKQIESYIRDHSDAEFSHGICPDCIKRLYPDISEIMQTDDKS
jgi:PAS domain S-box-containing protein